MDELCGYCELKFSSAKLFLFEMRIIAVACAGETWTVSAIFKLLSPGLTMKDIPHASADGDRSHEGVYRLPLVRAGEHYYWDYWAMVFVIFYQKKFL